MNDNKENLFLGANSKLFEKANKRRKESTEAEIFFWKKVRNQQILGLKFRREHPIKTFIFDFYIPSLKIGIEIDGGYHEELSQMEYDENRTIELNKHGINIIRFSNDDILKNYIGVLKDLLEFIDQVKNS